MEQNVKHCSSAYVRPAENKANFMLLVHDFDSSFLVAPKKTSCVALISSFLSYGRCMQEAQSRVYPVTQGRLKRWPSIGLQHVSSFLSHGQVINQSNCLSIITKGNSCLDGLYANQKKIPNRNSGYVHLVQVQLGSCTMQG